MIQSGCSVAMSNAIVCQRVSRAPPGAVQREPVRLRCEDGQYLDATWTWAVPQPHAVVVINAATGVARRYYQAFADWLAQRGYRVLSYDYRGIAGSLHGPIRHCRASMADWARYDIAAALATAAKLQLPILLVGHSAGGNLLGRVPGLQQASAIVTIGAQNACWRLWSGWRKWGLAFVWYLALPILTQAYGYLPGRWLGASGQSLPRQVARDWANWARRRQYVFDAPGLPPARYSEFAGPVQVWSVSDDSYAPPAAVADLARRFGPGGGTLLSVSPAQLGLARIGHFGIFRRQIGMHLWPLLLQQIELACPALRPRHGCQPSFGVD